MSFSTLVVQADSHHWGCKEEGHSEEEHKAGTGSGWDTGHNLQGGRERDNNSYSLSQLEFPADT